MPVQDNDDKRTNDQPVVGAEEELRRKQTQAQEHEHENNIQKSGKLLPFLNAKAEHQRAVSTPLMRRSPIRRIRSTETR